MNMMKASKFIEFKLNPLSNGTEINSVDVHVDSFFKYKSLHENNGAEFKILFSFRPEHCT